MKSALLQLLPFFALIEWVGSSLSRNFLTLQSRGPTGIVGDSASSSNSSSSSNNPFLIPNATIESQVSSNVFNVSGFLINLDNGGFANPDEPTATLHLPANLKPAGTWGWPAWDQCPSPLANTYFERGYCAEIYANNIGAPRGIIITPGGNLLVVETTTSKILKLVDSDHNGIIDANERISIVEQPGLNHGIAFDAHNNHLYASSDSTVYRWSFDDANGVLNSSASSSPTIIVHNIPTGGHSTRTLLLDSTTSAPSQFLFVSVGSSANLQPDISRARIMRYDITNIPSNGYDYENDTDTYTYAYGLRNSVGMTWDVNGNLWAVDNGIDNVHRLDLGGDIHQTNPAEELNLIREGEFYGYPYCFSEYFIPDPYGMGKGTQWVDEPFKSSFTDIDCRNTSNVNPPVIAFPAHFAPLGISFYPPPSQLSNNSLSSSSNNTSISYVFPAPSRDSAFVAFHGSWNSDSPVGYKIARIQMKNDTEGTLDTKWTKFFGYAGVNSSSLEWLHRPVNIAFDNSLGDMFITSDASSAVIRIRYVGEPPAEIVPVYPP